MNIEELERILAEHPFLPKPKYVYLVKERVVGVRDNMLVLYKGATPIQPRDRIALTVDADDVTVVHELLHVLGFGEIGAYALARPIRMLRSLLPPVRRREVKYELVDRPHPNVEVYMLRE